MCLARLEIECEFTLEACNGLTSGLQRADIHPDSDFISAWLNVLTRRSPRGAENLGEEKEKLTESSRGGGETEAGEENYNSRFKLFPIITLASLYQVLTVTQPAFALPNFM